MKRIARIILSIMFALPIFVGGLFMLSTNESIASNNVNSNIIGETTIPFSSGEEEKDTTDKAIPSDSPLPNVDPSEPPTVEPVDPNSKQVQFDDSVFESATWTSYASAGFAGGTGTMEDPYQISSAEDLAYMRNALQLDYKLYKGNFFVITNDIVLNDGYFESDGTYHDGGDGLFYAWEPIPVAEGMVFDGQNHSIIGMYVDRGELTGSGLFGASEFHIKEIKNLHIENSYITGDRNISVLGLYVEYISNCSIDNTTLNGRTAVSSFALYILNEITNCVSSADIFCSERAGGLVIGTYDKAKITKCKFEGKIISTGNNVGGILAYNNYDSANIDSCEVSAYIEGCGANIGGFAGAGRYCTMQIFNSVFTGEVVVRNEGAAQHFGGTFIGFCQNGNYNLHNCKNYGAAYGTDSNGKAIGSGGMIYTIQVTNASNGQNTNVNITSCKNFVHDVSLVREMYMPVRNLKIIVNISNCEITANGPKLDGAIVNRMYGKSVIDVVNIQNIIINVNTNVSSFSLFNLCNAGNVEIRNVIVNLREQESELKQFILPTAIPSRMDVKSVLINQNVNEISKNYYYGYNFRDFFSDWRNGKIGLKTMQAVGTFCSSVNESVLKNKGYVKL